MKIKEILELEELHNQTINFFISGSFVKVYNRSFYLLTVVLGRRLRADMRYVKSADNQFVVSGGFPEYLVGVNYPHAAKTNWGFQIYCDYNADAYAGWLFLQKSAA